MSQCRASNIPCCPRHWPANVCHITNQNKETLVLFLLITRLSPWHRLHTHRAEINRKRFFFSFGRKRN